MATMNELHGDLVAAAKAGSHVAHCVSADFRIGAGVAKQLDAAFDLRTEVLRDVDFELRRIGNVVRVKRRVDGDREISIFNLITKSAARDKPTYFDFETAVARLRDACAREEITELSMPRMGCGLDGLEWTKVREIIRTAFEDFAGVTLTVYEFDPRRDAAPAARKNAT